MKSIRQYLLIGLFSTLLLATVASFIISYLATTEEIGELHDARLIENARFISGFLNQKVHKLNIERINEALSHVKETQLERGETYNADGHAYERKVAIQVWDKYGQLLLSTPSAPPHALSSLTKGFSQQKTGNHTWFIYTQQIPANHHWLMVAERSDIREEMRNNILLSMLLGAMFAFILMMILIKKVIKTGLDPLVKLSNAMQERDLDYLQPVKLIETPPAELKPVLHALNHLLGRLDEGLERERRFLADAAHELRTPLTVLKLQLQLAQQASNLPMMQQGIDKALLGVNRSTHVVEQLLTLARLEPDKQRLQRSSVDMVKLAQEITALQVPLALAKQQKLAFIYDENVSINYLGNSILLGILLRNLIDNALRYTPEGGSVEVMVKRQDNGILLAVYDTGCGVPEEDIPRLMQRFYRHEQSADTQGTGLGLSIVQRIAELHEAKINIYNRDVGGLAVEVTLKQM